MALYLDVIWFLNFCIDFLLIVLTGMVLKRKMQKWRLITGSLIGSSYVLLLFVPSEISMYHPLIKFGFSLLIMAVSFGFKKFSYFIKNVGMFYFVSFVTGGGLFAAHYFLQSDLSIMQGVLATRGTGKGDVLSWAFVCIGFPAVWLFSKRRVDDIKVQKLHYTELVQVEIRMDDTTIHATGLIDSGNKLHDPITKVPVMILDMNEHYTEFPEEIISFTKDIHAFSDGETCAHPWEARLRIVPFRAVGKDNDFLPAIKPDEVRIISKTGKFSCTKVLIGFSYTSLSSENNFSCIVHPEVMSNGMEQIAAS
ncbi:stage II sporulation protein GA (sporulation sigma-E factor processing peptidase) [Fictibacillus solisalsi]|uniref:Sporulation sigma-E factor-processing peptidase n=1 Tax=Fictibacillus solisalsi TaxID=459525 RepID=A0A1G9UTA2_9BACL|nr:sigma-E processing peptidase SpoIIGA [Fictibacillus solisalsi]SDM63144.1 stage II sporulation protein GA (sporulation sigma-E factor processing peptidase) [Fictibacillus solisalsi]